MGWLADQIDKCKGRSAVPTNVNQHPLYNIWNGIAVNTPVREKS
jgi:hypothetical protein